MKNCFNCNQIKPFTEFNKNSSKKDGLQARCRECQKSYFKQYYDQSNTVKVTVKNRVKQRRLSNKKALMEHLSDKSCMDCSVDNILVLEFDHLRDKRKSISALVHEGASWQTILDEIAKCDIVCANCHRIRTYERSNSFRNRWISLDNH